MEKGSSDNELKYCSSFTILVIMLDVWIELGNKAHSNQ